MGVDAFGTVLSFSTDGGTVYNPVANVTEVGVLDVSVDTLETTTHGSAGQWRTFVSGLKDGGELRMSINYDPTTHNEIYSEIGQDDTKFRVSLPDTGAATVSFDGVITGWSSSAPMDDLLTAEITIKVSGAPVIVL